MTTLTQTAVSATTAIHPATHPGYVHLTVANLGKQIEFYRDVLGFKLNRRDGAEAALGAGKEDLLRLTEVPGAHRSRGTTGLYHAAFLVPTRLELAQLVSQLAETATPVEGLSNHGTHLAIYLPDAEGNGLELAWDFPRERWPRLDDREAGRPQPLDLDDLLSALGDEPPEWAGLDPATQVGHVHLRVSDLDATQQFYHDVLGLDTVSADPSMGMAFFSAGGYHHHVGTNIWLGAGAPPPPPNALGLRHFSLVLPDRAELEKVVERVRQAGLANEAVAGGTLVRDPARNGVLLTAA
jgi:catechol 2,3-dioxygenase